MTDPIENAMNRVWGAACKGVDDAVQQIYTISKEERCPVDKGKLKASAKNELVENSNEKHTRQISYHAINDDGQEYSVIVHERLDLHHPHGSAKYLEGPVDENRDKVSEMVQTAIRGVL